MHRIQFPYRRLLALLALVGCGGGGAETRPAAAGYAASLAGGAAPSAASPAAGGGADAFEVTVAGSGSPQAGTHRGTGKLGCMVHNRLWQANWEAPAETGLSSLLLQLKEVPASGGSSNKLTFTAVFGSQEKADAITAMVDVHGSEFGRDGRGTVTREGKGAVIRIEGTAQQGSRVTTVLRCASVEEMS
jgi:hypothetical protein